MILPSCPKLFSGKHLCKHYPFYGRTASVFWKDKPVGGMLTGPTKCESLRLVLRHIIRFYFLQNFDKPLCLQYYSRYPMNRAYAIRLPRNKTSSVLTCGSLRTLPEGEQMLKRVPLSLCHFMEVSR